MTNPVSSDDAELSAAARPAIKYEPPATLSHDAPRAPCNPQPVADDRFATVPPFFMVAVLSFPPRRLWDDDGSVYPEALLALRPVPPP